jgi:hypothetical protein
MSKKSKSDRMKERNEPHLRKESQHESAIAKTSTEHAEYVEKRHHNMADNGGAGGDPNQGVVASGRIIDNTAETATDSREIEVSP